MTARPKEKDGITDNFLPFGSGGIRVLIFTRQEGETIRIGEDIKITFLGQEKGNMKFSISAPRSVAILREELWKRIKERDANNN